MGGPLDQGTLAVYIYWAKVQCFTFALSYSLIIDDRLSYYWSPKYSVTYYSNYQTYLRILIENAKDVIYETCSFSDMRWSSLTQRK